MTALILVWIALGLAILPAGLFVWNLFLYRRAPQMPVGQATSTEIPKDGVGKSALPAVSILIPARNEADSIQDCVLAAVATQGIRCPVTGEDVVFSPTDRVTNGSDTNRLEAGDGRLEAGDGRLEAGDGRLEAISGFKTKIRQEPRPPSLETASRDSSLQPAASSLLHVAALPHCEILVLDDHSTDDTFRIVEELAERDPRIQVHRSQPLPTGWAGKQFACAQLAERARYPLLLFLDADVRLDPQGVWRMVQFLERSNADLVSGVPRQRMSGWLDWLLIPLIHFVLLGFLPLVGMRLTRWTAFGAGCGQLFLARRDAYHRAGGHRAIRQSFHDGVKLPRAFRRVGAQTDLVDATDLADCQMYVSSRDTWQGLSKNAVEGLAAPHLIVFATILLAGGQVLPFLLLGTGLICAWPMPTLALAGVAVTAAYLPRWVGALRFRQPWGSTWLHPLAILVFLAIQWSAFVRWLVGRPVSWKGRDFAGSTSPES